MEIITWPTSKNLQEKIREELSKGHELANQLRMVVHNDHDGSDAKGFVKQILSSFTTSLSLLSVNPLENKRESVALPTIVDSSSSWNTPKPIRSKEMPTDHGTTSTKKRKAPHTWSKDAADYGDTYAWRKYGQKHILHAPHPRSYFRCSHKNEQDCKAIKQVQKVEDDPSLYRITYIGNHTCNHNLSKSSSELVLGDFIDSCSKEEAPNSKFMITYGNTNLPYEPKNPIYECYNSTETEREIVKSMSDIFLSSQLSSLYCDGHLVQYEQPGMFESSENIDIRLPDVMDQLQFAEMAMMENFPQEFALPML